MGMFHVEHFKMEGQIEPPRQSVPRGTLQGRGGGESSNDPFIDKAFRNLDRIKGGPFQQII